MFTATSEKTFSIILASGGYRDEKDQFTNCRITTQEESYTAGIGRYKLTVLEQGSKSYIHDWQYDMNNYFKSKYGEYPSLVNSVSGY